MAVFHLSINKKKYAVDVDPSMPLLWVIRDFAGLTGTKYGCGIAECGACTIHLNGEAVRSCVLPVGGVGEKEITTIEGLSEKGDHPLQLAWKKLDVPQCGYCQAGQIMAASALLRQHPKPSDQDISEGMTNICRCCSYTRIREAIKEASGQASANIPALASER
jgi:aerobic-type carbon monoxide dehydrogenase small subunit (CoxS/CutS family)